MSRTSDNRRKGNKKNKNKSGTMSITIIVIFLLVVMSVQIVRLYNKNQDYVAQEQRLNEQLEQETERQQEITDYEAYTQTPQYIEDQAHSKLGLVYDNEIIFKEK